jgi:glucokinase
VKEVIGIDIGGTKIAGGCLRMDGEGFILDEVRLVDTPTGPEAIMRAVIELCRDLYAAYPAAEAVGIGAAGQIDVERGLVHHAVETIPGWTGMPIREQVQQRIDLPVAVDNDVNVMALAEMHFGAGRDYRHMLFLTVGTGIGGAVVLDGKLWRGTHWNAGELGHILVDWHGERVCTCGAHGHLEAYAAGPAMATQYSRRSGLNTVLDLREISQRAQAGDAIAQAAIQQGATILGLALAGLVNILDPEAVIIGGGVPGLGDIWWTPLREAFGTAVFPHLQTVPLLLALLGEQATMIGAARLACDRITP